MINYSYRFLIHILRFKCSIGLIEGLIQFFLFFDQYRTAEYIKKKERRNALTRRNESEEPTREKNMRREKGSDNDIPLSLEANVLTIKVESLICINESI